MVPSGILRTVGISGLNRPGDDSVLNQRATEAVRNPQLKAAVGLQGPTQSVRLLLQVIVAAGIIYDPMEPRVGVVVTIRVTLLLKGLALLKSRMELAQLLAVDSAGAETGRHSLQLRHDLEPVRELGQAQLSHIRALLGVNRDEP